MARIGISVCVCIIACIASAQETAWTYAPPAGHIDVSPGIGDLNADGHVEIVAGTTAGLVVALDAQGKELWRRETGSAVCIPPTVADVTGDAALEVLALNRQGRVLCLKGENGKIVWDTVLPAPPEWGMTTLAVGDLDGDGRREVVTGDRDGDLICLRGTGDLAWIYRKDLGKLSSSSLVDIDRDGRVEILTGTEKTGLVCLSSSGTERWRTGKGPGGSPVVCDLDGKDGVEIVIGIGSALCAFDSSGKSLWSYPMKREIDSAISVADIDDDGSIEVLAVDLSGTFVCLSSAGKLRWTAAVEERVRRSPSVGDVDGDGALEILVAGYSRAVHVFDVQGNLESRVALPGPSNATATLAVLGDLGLCAIVPAAGASMQVLRWPGSMRDARVLWPEYRFDSRRTGIAQKSDGAQTASASIPDRLDVDWGAMYVGTNFVKAIVHNPDRRPWTLSLEITRDMGEAQVTEVDVDGESSERYLPYLVPATESTELRLVCTLKEDDRVIDQRERTARIVPFAKEVSDASRLLGDIRDRLPLLSDAIGLEERLCFAAARLDTVRPRLAAAGTADDDAHIELRETLSSVLRDVNELNDLSQKALTAASEGHNAAVRAANPWRPFGGMADFNNDAANGLTVLAFGGEKESAALNIFNFSDTPRAFRIEIAPLKHGEQTVLAKESVSLFEVLDVPTERTDMSADALAAMNSANVLTAPAWSARQLWLNIDSRALSPGEWTSEVLIRSLEVTPIALRVPLSVTIAKAQVSTEQPLRNCGWGYVHSSMLKDYPEEALRDQVEHGTNVFVGLFAPKAQFDADGNLTGEIDFSEHDPYVKQHAPHGIILFCGYQGALQGPGDVNSEAYAKAYVQWVRAWVNHLTELGVGYEGYALYPIDEPGLHNGLVDAYLRMAKLTREADPRVQMYTDPVGGITEDELRSMLPYVDIWCPNRGGLLLEKANAEKLAIIKSSGKPVWTYECDDNAKHLSPLGYYRGIAWLAWQHGLTGIGFWSYCTSVDDPWFVPNARYDYLLVYPGNGVVTSKRWEAVRDGIEDYGILATLRKTIQSKETTAKPESIAAANSLLETQASRIAAFCIVDDDNELPAGAGVKAIRARTEDRQWAEVQRVRREMRDLLDAM